MLPLGRVERLDAVQAIGGGTVWAVGTAAILTTSDGGRTWVRVWRGAVVVSRSSRLGRLWRG
jgi:photosystem II stability/assembly factor-like uncharacterized protein